MVALKEYWDLVLNNLQTNLSKSNFQTWFSRVEFLRTTNAGKKIIVQVPSIFNKNYIKKKFSKLFLDSIQKYYPRVSVIEYEISKEEVLNENGGNLLQEDIFFPENQNTTEFKKPQVNLTKIEIPSKNIHNLNSKYTLDNFVVTKSNQLAVMIAKSIIEKPGVNYNPVFLYSGVGMGKTHLLQAIGNTLVSKSPNLRVRYTTCEMYFNLFINGIVNKKSSDFIEYYRSTDVLLIDDIQFINGREATQEAFFHTFNELHQNNKQIVITSDKHPKNLEKLEDRLVSRFEWGIVVDISKPELEDRIAVTKFKSRNLGLSLTDIQIDIIAGSIDTNFRDLEGILNRISARCRLIPDTPLRDSELKELLANSQITSSTISININSQLTSKKIVDSIEKVFSVSKEEIMGKIRISNVALARQIAMYLCKTELKLSYPVIGKIFKRDHTTAMHAYKTITKRMKNDTWLSLQIQKIKSTFSS